jgi:hypothetical protein
MTPGFFLPYVRPQICGRFGLCKHAIRSRASAVTNRAKRRNAAIFDTLTDRSVGD